MFSFRMWIESICAKLGVVLTPKALELADKADEEIQPLFLTARHSRAEARKLIQRVAFFVWVIWTTAEPTIEDNAKRVELISTLIADIRAPIENGGNLNTCSNSAFAAANARLLSLLLRGKHNTLADRLCWLYGVTRVQTLTRVMMSWLL